MMLSTAWRSSSRLLAFNQRSVSLIDCQTTAQEEAYRRGDRLRSPGGGRKGNFDSNEKKLFFILHYIKTYPTFDVLGYLFDMDGGNACTHVHTLLPLLNQALETAGIAPKRVLENPQALKKLLDSDKDILIDATKRECVRAQAEDQQKAHYSGKKKTYYKEHGDFYELKKNPLRWPDGAGKPPWLYLIEE